MPDDTGQDPTADAPDTSSEQQHSMSTITTSTANVPDTDSSNSGGLTENELRRARDDAAKFRQQLRESQKALKDAQDALQAKDDVGKSEMQKAMDRVAEQEARLQVAESTSKTLRLQNEVMLAAQKQDIVDPDAAFRLLDKDSVDYDGDRPMNISALLEDLVAERPYLKAQQKQARHQAAAPSNSSTTQPASKPGNLTMDDIEGMTSDEINERWAEVQPVLESAAGPRGTRHTHR